MLSVKVHGDKAVLKRLGGMEALLTDHSLLSDLGDLQTFLIKQRTLSGQDVDGSPFRDYSPEWAAERSKKGRPTGHVDLTFYGRMLAGIQQRIESDTVVLFFAATEAAKASGNQQLRDFFGVADSDADDLLEEVRDFFGGAFA